MVVKQWNRSAHTHTRTHTENLRENYFFVHQASHLLGYGIQDRLDGFGMEDGHGCTVASFTVLGKESEK